jgi:hypothetical protein
VRSSRRLARLALAVVVLCGGARGASARYEGNFNLFAGEKWMNSADWGPADEQREYGLALAFAEERAPVHFAMDAFVASTEVSSNAPDALVKSQSSEFALGVRKVWGQGVTHPHLGAGANTIRVREERNGPSGLVASDDRTYGVWVDAGISWRIAGHLNLGLEARYSAARANIGAGSIPRDVAAGGVHLGALIGYGW